MIRERSTGVDTVTWGEFIEARTLIPHAGLPVHSLSAIGEPDDFGQDLGTHLAVPHLVQFAGRLDNLIDENAPPVIEQVRQIA